MTLARPVGSPPTGPVSLDRAFGRAATFACAGAIAALNAHADQIIASLRDFSVAVSMTTLCGISAVIWVAMLAVLKIGFETDHQEIGRGDILVLIFVVTSSLLPIGYLSDVASLPAPSICMRRPLPAPRQINFADSARTNGTSDLGAAVASPFRHSNPGARCQFRRIADRLEGRR